MDEAREADPTRGAPDVSRGERAAVLVVAADWQLRELLETTLSATGCAVERVATPAAALELLIEASQRGGVSSSPARSRTSNDHRPSVLVVDDASPGSELLELLGYNASLRRPAGVVIVTSSARDYTSSRGLYVLEQPFGADELLASVREALRTSSRQRT